MEFVRGRDVQKPLKNVPCATIRNPFCLCVVIELISSKWKVITSCADLYITDIFFSCKRVINEWTHKINCKLSHTHQCTRPQEVNKNTTVTCVSSLLLKLQEFNRSKQWPSETIFRDILWPVEHVRRNF